MQVKKAVIPAAGLGTRFLPATKALAKEMLPIVDIPTLQYQIKEAVDAGIEEVILIISDAKKDIIEHFKRNEAYENYLISNGKQKEAVGNEPFVIILGDDLIINEHGDNVSKQMIDIYNKYHNSIIGCQNVALENVNKYGIMSLKSPMENRIALLKDMVEKPDIDKAPSRLACLGRYLLTPEIFDILKDTKPGKGGEIQLTDAIKVLAKSQDVIVYDFIGRRYDVGDKYGYVEATIDFALKRDDMKEKVLNHLKEILLKGE